MSMQARSAAAYARRVTAALAFWLAAVLFVIDVTLVFDLWPAEVAAAAPEPVAQASLPPSAEPSEPADVAESETATPSPLSPAGGVDVALDGGATITFPQPPSQSQQVVQMRNDEAVLVMHAATTPDETTYNVGVIEYPDSVDVSDPAVNLIGSVSGAASNSNSRVTMQEVAYYDGAPAIAFRLEARGATVLARNVLVGDRLYATSVSFTTGAKPADAEAFLDSLDLPED